MKLFSSRAKSWFGAWQALVDGYAPMSSNDPAKALQPILATPKRRNEAKALKETHTAWSLKVAEYEHQHKVTDETKKTMVVREIVQRNDVRLRTSTAGLGKFGPHDAKTTQSDQDTSNDMSCDDVCYLIQSWQLSRQEGRGREHIKNYVETAGHVRQNS